MDYFQKLLEINVKKKKSSMFKKKDEILPICRSARKTSLNQLNSSSGEIVDEPNVSFSGQTSL